MRIIRLDFEFIAPHALPTKKYGHIQISKTHHTLSDMAILYRRQSLVTIFHSRHRLLGFLICQPPPHSTWQGVPPPNAPSSRLAASVHLPHRPVLPLLAEEHIADIAAAIRTRALIPVERVLISFYTKLHGNNQPCEPPLKTSLVAHMQLRAGAGRQPQLVSQVLVSVLVIMMIDLVANVEKVEADGTGGLLLLHSFLLHHLLHGLLQQSRLE